MNVEDIPIDEDIDPDQPIEEADSELERKLREIRRVMDYRRSVGLPQTLEIDPKWAKFDRAQGIFTETDRQYLSASGDIHGNEIDEQREREIRYRFRQRLTNVLLDSNLLQRISRQDLESVIKNIGPGGPYLLSTLVHSAVRGLRVGIHQEVGSTSESDLESFYEELFSEVIQRTETELVQASEETDDPERGQTVSASVHVDLEKRSYNLNQTLEAIVQGNATHSQFVEYWQRGDREKLVEELEQKGKSKVSLRDGLGIGTEYKTAELRNELDDQQDGDESTATIELLLNAIQRRKHIKEN